MLKPLSLSNNKNQRLRKVKFFLWNKRKTAVKLTVHHNQVVIKSITGKILKSLIIISILNPENFFILRRYRLLGQTTKQPLSNFETRQRWKYKQLFGLRPDPSCLEKSVYLGSDRTFKPSFPHYYERMWNDETMHTKITQRSNSILQDKFFVV